MKPQRAGTAFPAAAGASPFVAAARAVVVVATLAGIAQPGAAPMPPAPRAEVDALLARLANSGCQFNRNGSWYPGHDARTHLLRKLEAIERDATLPTAEAFIDVAASRSSVSGTPYQVRCGTAAPVPSASWLSEELKAVRAATRAPAK